MQLPGTLVSSSLRMTSIITTRQVAIKAFSKLTVHKQITWGMFTFNPFPTEQHNAIWRME
jgi:hypothetical protein